jgi:hypothetical protein
MEVIGQHEPRFSQAIPQQALHPGQNFDAEHTAHSTPIQSQDALAIGG